LFNTVPKTSVATTPMQSSRLTGTTAENSQSSSAKKVVKKVMIRNSTAKDLSH